MSSEVKVDRRTPHAIYVEVGDMTVYIDNSTLEQIVDISFDDDVPYLKQKEYRKAMITKLMEELWVIVLMIWFGNRYGNKSN